MHWSSDQKSQCILCGKKHAGTYRWSRITCFKCSKIGHYQRECKEKSKLCKEQTKIEATSHLIQQPTQSGPVLDKDKRMVEIEFWEQNS